jgi:hypothetical protein
MEYTDNHNAAVDDTNKRASKKVGISAAIVDALGGASTTERQRQEAIDALEPVVPFAMMVEVLPKPGEVIEPARARVG